MTIEQANEYFSSLPEGFAPTEELSAALTADARKVQFVGVAGTAGKTAAAGLLAAILREAAFHTGFYRAGCEPLSARIAIGGVSVDPVLFCQAAEALSAAKPLPRAAAELAAAACCFGAAGCKLAVVELPDAGLAAALPSMPVCAVTAIGPDGVSRSVERLAALAAGWVLSRLLSRPLQQLETAMEQFEQDADHFAFQAVRGTREVQNLSDSFGHMVGRIQQLMTTVREEEIVLRKTELKALQAQINPHFLYNTLDSIAWMCERGKNADAVQMVHALARLFRISISRGHELIPIEKELQHAEAYLQIQKYRYKNQFTYHFTVDESCLHCLCNKITLQPIIENAIVHGLDLMVDSGHIEITVKPDGDDILLIVADDGIGMEPEQVAALLQNEPSDRTGIGVKNVNDRLRIYFGADYGISIESAPYEGTTVTIRTPRVPEDREGDYDKNH